ncbi:hypothetical protein VTJ04DRAFT_6303 [Mycothermus thermophilus]
MANSVK